jgi:hypothetical protein
MKVEEFIKRKTDSFFDNEFMIRQLDCFQNSNVIFSNEKHKKSKTINVIDGYYTFKKEVIIHNWLVNDNELIIDFTEYE